MPSTEELPQLSMRDLYHQAKAAKEAQNWPQVCRALTALARTDASQRQDRRLGNAVGWLIHYADKFFLSLESPDTQAVIQLLELAQAFTYETAGQPSAYAMLLRLALKTRKQNPYFLAWVEWWDLRNLQPQDYTPYQVPGGPQLPSLAEQVLLGTGKHLLAGYTVNGALPPGEFDREAIAGYIDTLGPQMEAHPEYGFLPYLRAQLYLALEQPEAALEDLRPFVQKNQHQSWAWDWLGRAYFRLGEAAAARACLARALSARAPDKVTVLTRERYARLCLEAGEAAEAKAHFEKVIATRLQEWGKIPARIEQVLAEPWYDRTPEVPLAQQNLNRWASQAQQYLHEAIEEELAVVTAVHSHKPLAWYRLDRERSGNFKPAQFGLQVQPGDVLRLRVQARKGQEEVWYEALSARLTPEAPPKGLTRQLKGTFELASGKPFGFVDREGFVPPAMVQRASELLGQQVAAWAIAEYDRKRKRWGWQVIRMHPA